MSWPESESGTRPCFRSVRTSKGFASKSAGPLPRKAPASEKSTSKADGHGLARVLQPRLRHARDRAGCFGAADCQERIQQAPASSLIAPAWPRRKKNWFFWGGLKQLLQLSYRPAAAIVLCSWAAAHAQPGWALPGAMAPAFGPASRRF